MQATVRYINCYIEYILRYKLGVDLVATVIMHSVIGYNTIHC